MMNDRNHNARNFYGTSSKAMNRLLTIAFNMTQEEAEEALKKRNRRMVRRRNELIHQASVQLQKMEHPIGSYDMEYALTVAVHHAANEYDQERSPVDAAVLCSLNMAKHILTGRCGLHCCKDCEEDSTDGD